MILVNTVSNLLLLFKDLIRNIHLAITLMGGSLLYIFVVRDLQPMQIMGFGLVEGKPPTLVFNMTTTIYM